MQYAILKFPFSTDSYTACRENVPKLKYWSKEIYELEYAATSEDRFWTEKPFSYVLTVLLLNQNIDIEWNFAVAGTQCSLK